VEALQIVAGVGIMALSGFLPVILLRPRKRRDEEWRRIARLNPDIIEDISRRRFVRRGGSLS
jgi:hypothetical protein